MKAREENFFEVGWIFVKHSREADFRRSVNKSPQLAKEAAAKLNNEIITKKQSGFHATRKLGLIYKG